MLDAEAGILPLHHGATHVQAGLIFESLLIPVLSFRFVCVEKVTDMSQPFKYHRVFAKAVKLKGYLTTP